MGCLGSHDDSKTGSRPETADQTSDPPANEPAPQPAPAPVPAPEPTPEPVATSSGQEAVTQARVEAAREEARLVRLKAAEEAMAAEDPDYVDESAPAAPVEPAPAEEEAPTAPEPEPAPAPAPEAGMRMSTEDRRIQEVMLAETADEVFASYDKDGNGFIDPKELQELITHCLKKLPCTDEAEEEQRDELLQEFSTGSREYCLSALKLIKDDAKLDLATFKDWLKMPDNFLFYPFKKFRVMLWAFDLFRDFDIDGDGMVSESEFDMAMKQFQEEIDQGTEDESVQILAEFKFDDYDWEDKDSQVSTRELVTVMLGMWERLYEALFSKADDFFG